MRLKYYLRGLGLGIIFTCLMFMLFSNKTANNNTDQTDIYNQIDAATETLSNETGSGENNDTANDASVTDDTDVQNDANVSDNLEAQNGQDTQNNPQAQDNAEAQNSADNQTDDSNITGETGTDDVQDGYVTLVIEKGDIARDVAESLYEDGIIDDVESFRKYLGETGVSRTLHAGEYNIKVGSTYEEIVELLK